MQMICESQPAAPETPVTVTMNRMARMLNTVRPPTDAEALRMLRVAFPETTLRERIAALARHANGLRHVS